MLKQLLAISLGIAAASDSATAATDDDFSDGVRGSQWSLVEDDPSLKLSELNVEQRLNVISTGPALPITDALYLSNGPAGFKLSTASNFEIAIDYSFTQAGGGNVVGQALALVFGVGNDDDGQDSAAIGFGFARRNVTIPGVGTFPVTGFGALAAHRTNDVQTSDGELPLAPQTGTFVIAYDAANDDLILSIESVPTPIATLDNIVAGQWAASELLVSFGARGDGFTTAAGDAFLDNFEIRSGAVVPEPASLALLSLTGLALVRRRR